MNVSESDLKKFGVFNKTLDEDSEYSFSYYSIKHTAIPEFRDAFKKMQTYFIGLIGMAERMLELNSSDNEYKELSKKMTAALQFTEPRGLGLGYSKSYKNCKGWTKEDAINCQIKLIEQVRRNKNKFVNYKERITSLAPITISSIKGIGFDKHSDMIGNILFDELRQYTHNVTQEFMKLEGFNNNCLLKEDGYLLPYYKPGYRILFIPYELISKQYNYFDIMGVIYDVIQSAQGDDELSRYVKKHYNDITQLKKKEKKSHQKVVNKNLKNELIKLNIDEVVAELPRYADELLTRYFGEE